jgi:type I restriction enzyme S subunit
MSNWKKYKLGEISRSISYGYTESASTECIGPKFLRITDIVGKLNWNTVPYCKIDENNYHKYKLEKEDIVIARTGATTGATEIIKESIDAVFASYLIRYKIDNTIANPFYVSYVLKSDYWKNFVSSIIGGSAQPGANAKQFANFEINLPDLATQTQIAQILTSFDDKIELLGQMNQTLETMAQTIFKEWFVASTGSATYNGNPLPELVEGSIPKGWRMAELGAVSTLIAGGDNPKNSSSQPTEQNKIPIYSNGITNDGLYGFTSSARVFEESVTVSARGTIGFVCLRLKPYVPIVRLVSVIPKQEFVSAKYLYFWLKSKNINGTGTTQQQLTIPDFQGFQVLIPQIDLIKQFTLIANSFFDKIEDNQLQIRTLTQLRDTLLPKLMSGKIKIKE